MKTILRMEVMQSENSTGNGTIEGMTSILKVLNYIEINKKYEIFSINFLEISFRI